MGQSSQYRSSLSAARHLCLHLVNRRHRGMFLGSDSQAGTEKGMQCVPGRRPGRRPHMMHFAATPGVHGHGAYARPRKPTCKSSCWHICCAPPLFRVSRSLDCLQSLQSGSQARPRCATARYELGASVDLSCSNVAVRYKAASACTLHAACLPSHSSMAVLQCAKHQCLTGSSKPA